MKTGFIIINYNDFDSTKKLIDNIKNYSVIDKIIVVDNNSTDDSKTRLKKIKLDKLQVIINKDNKGYSYAINVGVKALIKEYKECNIIVSNADISIEKEDDLKQLIKRLQKKNIGVVAPTILEMGELNRGWKNPTPFMDSLMNIAYIHRIIRKKYIHYKVDHYKNDTSIVEVVSGCFFLTKSKVLEEINFFDEQVFLYYEENILAKKLEEKKLISLIDNTVTILHNHSVTIDKNLKKIKKYTIQRKSQYYYHVTYNKANTLEKILLKSTYFITKFILYIYYFFKDILINKLKETK
ncbi:MAG: glycosyltransferase family 2 protein [Firmicutes bacterium]|nr:glycosyltransferase family 2 protein [Bacillota bacterium]